MADRIGSIEAGKFADLIAVKIVFCLVMIGCICVFVLNVLMLAAVTRPKINMLPNIFAVPLIP